MPFLKFKSLLPFLKAGMPPSLVFLVHCIFSLGLNAYDRVAWLDVLMHISGGAAIAYFFDGVIHHLDHLKVIKIGDGIVTQGLIIGLVAVSAIAWEFAEFIADALFNAGAQRSIANVMKDQFTGLLGGIAYIAVFQRRPTGDPQQGASLKGLLY